MKKTSFWYLLFLIPFFGCFALALTEAAKDFEYSVFSFIHIKSDFVYNTFRFFTELGSGVGVIIIIAAALILSAIANRFFTFGLPVALTTLVSRALNITLKLLIDRPRPEFKVLEAAESSFPSGHAQNNMALYIAILLVALMITSAPLKRVVLKIVLISLPLIIGFTRIYFGVHYLSDVVAGWSMGIVVAVMAHLVYFAIYNKIRNKKDAET